MRRLSIGYGVVGLALSLTACGGGGSGGGVSPVGPTPAATVSPVLIPGTIAKYSGTDVTTHVFTSPSASPGNYTAGYSFDTTRTVENASSGSPGAIDVNAAFTYSVTQDPGTGVVTTSQISDTYINEVGTSVGTSLQETAAKSVIVGTDESAGASGGGPFTKTTTTTTSYVSPLTNGVYPLVAGATYQEPFARTVTTSATDANGATTDTATTFDVSSTDTVAADGSYTFAQQISNGESQTNVENSNGSGSISANGPAYTLSDTIGIPTNGGSGYVIPVTTEKQQAATGATPAPAATANAYSAADWYPGGALPITPFQTDVTTVKGAASTLPGACAGGITLPNMFELDTNASTLNIDASVTTTTQQNFVASGTPVCTLRTVTTKDYALTTGSLTQTSTETFAQILTGFTASAGASAAKRTL